MKLSEFLSILDSFLSNKVQRGIGTGRVTNGDKLRSYLNAFIQDKYRYDNPVNDKRDDFLSKVFNGTESLPKDIASYVREHLDFFEFEKFCDSLTDDAIENMRNDFNKSYLNISEDDFYKDVTDALSNILYYISVVKPSDSIKYVTFDGNTAQIGKTRINLLPDLVPPDEVLNNEEKYVEALLEVYQQDSNVPITKTTDLNKLKLRYKNHFTMQRKYFYSAESVLHKIRDVFSDGEAEFNKLKKETLEGIESLLLKPHKNGLDRLDNTLILVSSLHYGKATLGRDNNGLVGQSEKKGILHILVNDGQIEWVTDYDTDI